MASKTLYPPVLDSSMSAFIAGSTSKCRVYFSLSKFNSSTDFTSVQISVKKQSSGLSVIKKTDNTTLDRYRATGIVLNVKPVEVVGESNLYYVDVLNEDISTISEEYSGWIPGWIYKIQLRLSAVDYAESLGQAAWINTNASNFSEWSTQSAVKTIGNIEIQLPTIGYDSENLTSNSEDKVLYLSTLDTIGTYSCDDDSELLYSYQSKLYNELGVLIEDSGIMYTNQYSNPNQFNYIFKIELENEKEYSIEFTYITINGYKKTITSTFTIVEFTNKDTEPILMTLENDFNSVLNYSNIGEEEDEGRIALKILTKTNDFFNGNLCIRRTDSKSNFTEWVDIKTIPCVNVMLNELDVFYDYTIESGIWYKYGIQTIDESEERSVLNKTINPILRNFNYTFLLGKDNQQLKLKLNTGMETFQIKVSESSVETLGSKYPFVSRNGNVGYKTFSLSGLISFNMDDNELFLTKQEIYSYSDVVSLYSNYNADRGISQYDYIYEKDFRDKVLEFFNDGTAKLFKSPTEGNIIIRMTGISCTPDQTLGRMIYSFTSLASEIAEFNKENCLKYEFYTLEDYISDFVSYETKIGQIDMDIPVGTNIFELISNKYEDLNPSEGGVKKEINKIKNLEITINDIPLKTMNNIGETVIGNSFILNEFQFITIYNDITYYFDNVLEFTTSNSLILAPDLDDTISTINATINFLYEIGSEVCEEKEVKTKFSVKGVGQLFQNFSPNTSIYNEIYYKYLCEWSNNYRLLNTLSAVNIEANPGTVLFIRDASDNTGQTHDIGLTGRLNLESLLLIKEIKYLGVRNVDGSLNDAVFSDIIINYRYVLTQGTYQEEAD